MLWSGVGEPVVDAVDVEGSSCDAWVVEGKVVWGCHDAHGDERFESWGLDELVDVVCIDL